MMPSESTSPTREFPTSPMGQENILTLAFQQWRTEKALERRGIHFRSTNPDQLAHAYGSMKPQEFEGVNARQRWANWRTIPKALEGISTQKPWRILDLGCGTGSSVEVLAHYCPADSTLLGYDVAPALLEHARRKNYFHPSGRKLTVDFICQSLEDPLRDAEGRPLPLEHFNLVHSSGVIGHHFDRESFPALAVEINTLLEPGGSAILDHGPSLSPYKMKKVMAEMGFSCEGQFVSWVFAHSGQIKFVKEPRRQ